MRFTLIFILLAASNSLFSQVLQGFSDAESLGSAQTGISGHSAFQFLRQPAIPLEKPGFYAAFSSAIPAIQGLSGDFQMVFVKQNESNAYKMGIIQSGNSNFRSQTFVMGMSKKISPEIFMGINLQLTHSGIPEYESGNFPGLGISFYYKIKPGLVVASSLHFIKSTIQPDMIYHPYRINAIWNCSRQLGFGFMVNKLPGSNSSEQSLALRLQNENSFYVDLGSYIDHPEFTVGTGFNYAKSRFGFSSAYQHFLGMKFSCSIQFFIERKSK